MISAFELPSLHMVESLGQVVLAEVVGGLEAVATSAPVAVVEATASAYFPWIPPCSASPS
jgi:hypothetical protein